MVASKHPDDMTEEELARFFEEHRGDMSLWMKRPAKIRVRRGGPSTVFTLRLAPEELEKLHRAAREEETSVSDFIRSAALAAADRRARRRKTAGGATSPPPKPTR